MAEIAFAAVSLVISAFSAWNQYESSEEMKDQHEKMGELNAQLSGMETAEQVRRMELENEKVLSKARAAKYATGAAGDSGSFNVYEEHMRDVQGRELDWVKRIGLQKQEVAKMGGQVAGASYEQQKFSGFGGVMSSAVALGDASGWFNAGVGNSTFAAGKTASAAAKAAGSASVAASSIGSGFGGGVGLGSL